MKKFKFRLENVLKVRTLRKKIAEREAAATQNSLNHTEREIENCREAYAQSFEFRAAQRENVAFWHEVAARYQTALKTREQTLEDQKARLQAQLDAQKKQLRRTLKEERVLDNLKEHQRQEHQRESMAEEQREIEEIDILKRGRKT